MNKPPAESKPHLRSRWWLILSASVVLFSVPMVAFVEGDDSQALWGVWIVYVAIGVALRSPPVLCTLLGSLFGYGADPPIKGGTHESQAWETAQYLFTGTFAGFTVGLLLERIGRDCPPPRRPEPVPMPSGVLCHAGNMETDPQSSTRSS